MEENTVNAVETTEKTAKADKETVAKQTVAVLFMSIVIGVMIAVLDFVMKFGLSFIL